MRRLKLTVPRVMAVLLVILAATTGWMGYVAAVSSTSRNSVVEPGSMSEAYCTHLIYLDTATWFTKNCRTGANGEFTASTLSSVLNSVIASDDAAGGGVEFIQNSGVVTTGQWGTTAITLKASVKIDFEHGSSYNIAENGDVFAGTTANGYYNLVFNSVFYLYNSGEVFLHLSNSLDSNVYIAQIGSGSGSLIANSRAVLLDGNPAYYNSITILQMFNLDIGIYLPFVTVGANANILTVNYCQLNNYCIKIDQNVSDNFITRLVVGASGVEIAALWIDGFSNHAESVYGEYSSAGPNNGPVLLLSTHAATNTIYNLVQEGSDPLLTDSATVHSNLINTRFPALATRSVTAGASTWTFTNVDNTKEQIQMTTIAGLTSWVCKGVTMINAVGQISPVLNPTDTCLVNWTTTAPVFQVDPQ